MSSTRRSIRPWTAATRIRREQKDTSDNANSLALRLDYGDFRFWAGGDLTWNIEHRLVCPVNRVGAVSLYLTDHHGLNQSNNPALVQALRPRVAVMNCGAVKGGDVETTATLRATPSIEAIYQSHRVHRYHDEGNAPAERIANAGAGVPGMCRSWPRSRRTDQPASRCASAGRASRGGSSRGRPEGDRRSGERE